MCLYDFPVAAERIVHDVTGRRQPVRLPVGDASRQAGGRVGGPVRILQVEIQRDTHVRPPQEHEHLRFAVVDGKTADRAIGSVQHKPDIHRVREDIQERRVKIPVEIILLSEGTEVTEVEL